jgi:AcrR family transcriptional regulator
VVRRPAANAAAPRTRADSRAPQVLERAAVWFARKGYEAASIRTIVAEVGMLPGSLYAHFANKEQLLLAVYAEGVRRIRAAVDQAVARESEPWARLTAACAAHLEALAARNAFAQVVVRVHPDDVPAARARLVALRRDYEAVFRGLIADLPLPADSDRRALRLLLLGALNWSPAWFSPRAGAPARVAAAFIAWVREGARRE